MLLRDLLVALPGLIGPAGSSRVDEIDVQASSQIVTAAATASAARTPAPVNADMSSSFMDKALKDFHQKTGF